ncbi:MAG TPA: CBS domain-containing protein [Gaiellaceae bacterium]
MKVRDVMTEEVFTVESDTPLKIVATRMLEYGISGMPVVDGDRVLGVISETDVLFKERTAPDRKGLVDWLVHYAEDPPLAKLEARTAGQAMTTPAVTIAPGRSVADAAGRMLELSIDRLPVVDGDTLVGIVTRTDLVRAFTRGDEEIERDIREDGILRRFWLSTATIQITVKDGIVALGGRVASKELADSIVEFAEQTPGVVSVESKLTWPKTKPRRERTLV